MPEGAGRRLVLTPGGGGFGKLAGLRVGHYTDSPAGTGCTVLAFDPPAVAGVDVRGAAPGSREIALLAPECSVDRIDALVLCGGSALGLSAAGGVADQLRAEGRGHPTPAGPVPIVPAAVIYDLGVGDASVRPDAAAGAAAVDAASADPVAQGNIGAGTGATIGAGRMKGGLGSALIVARSVRVGAVAVVNPAGAVYEPATGRRMAGSFATPAEGLGQHTTIGVVAVDASLERWQLRKIAEMAHDGLARAVRPSHGMYDGDTIFAAAVGGSAGGVDLTTLGHAAAEAFAAAIVQGAAQARPAYGLPAAQA